MRGQLEEDLGEGRSVVYMKLRQSGVENEKFLLVKFNSQAHSFQSGLVLQPGLGNIRENLGGEVEQFSLGLYIVCRDCDAAS